MGETLLSSGRGQVTEFAVWSALLRQSHGALQVFLPLNDRGVDAILHHRQTGRFIPVQVKGRSRVHAGEIGLAIELNELRNPEVQIILVHTDESGEPVGDASVFDVATFLRHASAATDGHQTVQRAYIPVRPKAGSPWHGHAVTFDEIAVRIA